ncbi:MAG: hypothetical protein AAGE61_15480 [Pseudomonadota bacterium]
MSELGISSFYSSFSSLQFLRSERFEATREESGQQARETERPGPSREAPGQLARAAISELRTATVERSTSAQGFVSSNLASGGIDLGALLDVQGESQDATEASAATISSETRAFSFEFEQSSAFRDISLSLSFESSTQSVTSGFGTAGDFFEDFGDDLLSFAESFLSGGDADDAEEPEDISDDTLASFATQSREVAFEFEASSPQRDVAFSFSFSSFESSFSIANLSEEAPATEPPEVLEEPVVADEPAITEEPVVADEPIVAIPVINEEPIVAEAPAITEEPVIIEEPVVAETPTASEEPVPTISEEADNRPLSFFQALTFTQEFSLTIETSEQTITLTESRSVTETTAVSEEPFEVDDQDAPVPSVVLPESLIDESLLDALQNEARNQSEETDPSVELLDG